MRWPSITDVAVELRAINANVEIVEYDQHEPMGCDVRLQVYDTGKWMIHSGLSDYDQDHHGYWGASSVPGVVNGVVKRFNSRETARDLLEQAKHQYAQDQDTNAPLGDGVADAMGPS